MHSFTASMLNTILEIQLALASIQLYVCLILKRAYSPRTACVEIIWPTIPAIKRTQNITYLGNEVVQDLQVKLSVY